MAYESKRWYDDSGTHGIMCNDCVHNHYNFTCDAFPNGIIKEIIYREKHNTHFKDVRRMFERW